METLFTAPWCANCKGVKKWLSDRMIEIRTVDIEEEPQIAREAGVRALPSYKTDSGELISGERNIINYLKGKYEQ